MKQQRRAFGFCKNKIPITGIIFHHNFTKYNVIKKIFTNITEQNVSKYTKILSAYVLLFMLPSFWKVLCCHIKRVVFTFLWLKKRRTLRSILEFISFDACMQKSFFFSLQLTDFPFLLSLWSSKLLSISLKASLKQLKSQ